MKRLLLACLCASVLVAQEISFGQSDGVILNPANGHYYEAIDTGADLWWPDANELANSSYYDGMRGHLATVTSQEENGWLIQTFDCSFKWIGGFQNPSDPEYSEPDGGWKWITGEEWNYTNWLPGEPNNFGGDEAHLAYYFQDKWNDISSSLSGYIIEYEPPVAVSLDIKPGSCPNPLNTKSKGLLPVAILGTEDFDVNDVDLSTVQLEGVFPVRSNLEDVATPFDGELCDCHELGPDGFDDLTLKIDTQEIVAALGPVTDGEEIVLTLEVELLDGTPIEGQDCVLILKKGK